MLSSVPTDLHVLRGLALLDAETVVLNYRKTRRRSRRREPVDLAMTSLITRSLVLLFVTLSCACGNGDDNAVPVPVSDSGPEASFPDSGPDSTVGDAGPEASTEDAGADATRPVACTSSTPVMDGTDPDASVVIPIRALNINGDARFSIQVYVGGKKIDALLDTGSFGLRVMSDALGDAGVEAGTRALTANYNGGLMLQGVEGQAVVSLGGLNTPAPVPIMIVTGACQGSPCEPVDAGPPIYGFDAILGIGLRGDPNGIRSPIASLPGQRQFLIHTIGDPDVVGDDAGTLTIGVPSSPFTSYARSFQLEPQYPDASVDGAAPAWDDTGIRGCVNDETTGQSWCEGTLFDTGEATVYVQRNDQSSSSLKKDDLAQIIITGSGGCVFDDYTVPVDMPSRNQIQVRYVDASAPYINMSMLAFYRYDVLFDPRHGVITLGPR